MITHGLDQYRAFVFLIQPLLEARAKECTKFRWFFGVWENLVFCFRDLLTFSSIKEKWKIVANFCGLFRMSELYQKMSNPKKFSKTHITK